MKKYEILVCRGPECGDRRHAGDIYARFREVVGERELGERVTIARQSCFGRCRRGPNVMVREVSPDAERPPRFAFAALLTKSGNATLYSQVGVEDAERVVEEHVVHGRIVRDLCTRPRRTAAPGAGSAPGPGGAAPDAPGVQNAASSSAPADAQPPEPTDATSTAGLDASAATPADSSVSAGKPGHDPTQE